MASAIIKRLSIDLVISNATAFLMAAVTYFAGGGLLGGFMVALLLASALMLIMGGLFGFLLSSASIHAIDKRSGSRKAGKDDSTEKTRTRAEAPIPMKEQVRIGKRFALLGLTLLTESILLALATL